MAKNDLRALIHRHCEKSGDGPDSMKTYGSVAENMGVTYTYLYMLMEGMRRPSEDTILAISMELGVSLRTVREAIKNTPKKSPKKSPKKQPKRRKPAKAKAPAKRKRKSA